MSPFFRQGKVVKGREACLRVLPETRGPAKAIAGRRSAGLIVQDDGLSLRRRHTRNCRSECGRKDRVAHGCPLSTAHGAPLTDTQILCHELSY